MTPKLSIIIPVYNTEPYLRECLDSVVSQTYKDIEIIIVNDCSPDNSEEIILEYQQKDPRIKYIKHDQNLGLGGARNTGITHATGEWIAFIDSDDYIDLNTYHHMIKLLNKNTSCNLGIFSVINFNDTTEKEYFDPYFSIGHTIPIKIDHSSFFDIPNVTACTKIFKRSDIINHSLTFPEHLKHEDEAFWFKYIAIVEPTAIGCNKRFYHYRQRADSIMSSSNSRLNFPMILLNIHEFLVKNNLLPLYRKPLLRLIHTVSNYFFSASPSDKIIKFFTQIKELLSMINYTESELIFYPQLYYLHITKFVTNYSLLFLQRLQSHQQQLQSQQQRIQSLQHNKWYKFGQLSRKHKIKKIIVVLSKKLHIYPILQKIYHFIKR